jgi:hypothetical protein
VPVLTTQYEEFDCPVAGRTVPISVAVFEFRSRRGPTGETRRPISCAGFNLCGLFNTSALPQNTIGTGCPLIERVKRDPIWK